MSEKKGSRRGLGRGLSALMADVDLTAPSAVDESQPRGADRLVPIEQIEPNPDQPRRAFTQDHLHELSESIRTKGVLQPLIVRPKPGTDKQYEIVAGERRWRAAQMAKLHELPVIVRDYSDTEMLEVAIIENIQRADLTAIEEAAGYRQLMDRFGHTQEKLAEALGKSRSHIANLLRLLTLPEGVQNMVSSGTLSAGHARALITADDPLTLAKEVVGKGLSVRETEKLAKAVLGQSVAPRSAPRHTATEKDADTRALEGDLSAALGMKVTINHASAGEGGELTLRYHSLDQLDEICSRLSGGH